MAVGEFFANEPLDGHLKRTKLVVAGDAPAETNLLQHCSERCGRLDPGKDPVGLDPLSERRPRFA